MTFKRIIPVLLLDDEALVKTRAFKDPVYLGDPINAVKIFNDKEVDELLILDINASKKGAGPQFDLIEEMVSEAFMPIGYGGGITSLAQMHRLFRLGVEKVILNSSVFSHKSLIAEAVQVFGAQAIVCSIDAKKGIFGYSCYSHSGTKSHSNKPVALAQELEKLGVGEIIVGNISLEGTMNGYDLDLLRSITAVTKVPVVAMHGAGDARHLLSAITEGKASAVAAGSMFVFYGPHRGVLIHYLDPTDVQRIYNA
jgi:imidazole glycerol-phosphate synthase subunit HisF